MANVCACRAAHPAAWDHCRGAVRLYAVLRRVCAHPADGRSQQYLAAGDLGDDHEHYFASALCPWDTHHGRVVCGDYRGTDGACRAPAPPGPTASPHCGDQVTPRQEEGRTIAYDAVRRYCPTERYQALRYDRRGGQPQFTPPARQLLLSAWPKRLWQDHYSPL